MNDLDAEHLHKLGIEEADIQAFCDSLDESMDADEALRLLCIHFKLESREAAWLQRYLEDSSPL